MSNFVRANGIRLHYLDHPGSAPPIMLLHGLTANAHTFDGLLQAGLSRQHRVLSLDLRGRGLSDQPANGYRMHDHAVDVIGALDALGFDQLVIGGHSFGGMLSLFLAAHYPQRFTHVIVLDAAISVADPRTRDQLGPALARLGQSYPSWEAYLTTMQHAPYWDGWWHPLLKAYYSADVRINADGSVQPRVQANAIAAAIEGVLAEDWHSIVAAVEQPVLLCNATGAYGSAGAPPILTEANARATVNCLPRGRYLHVPGNHMTMLYGTAAEQITSAISELVSQRDIPSLHAPRTSVADFKGDLT